MSKLLWTLLPLLVLQGCNPVLSVPQQGQRPHQPRSLRRSAGKTDPSSQGRPESQGGVDTSETSISPELDFLADFVGKNRLWVITAPSHTDNYLRMMEKQIQDMESEGLSCRLAERDTVIVTIIQNAMMEGKIRRPSFQGEVKEEAIDTDLVTKLLHYLQLQDQSFAMLILKKNLNVGERFPYPVRVAAVLEVIDQLPVRKLEKLTRKVSTEKCKVIKKRVLVRKRGPQRKHPTALRGRGNFTSVPKQRKPLDKKAALKSQVQNILSGRSRFVIRKESAGVRGAQTSATDRADSRSLRESSQKQVTGRKTIGGNADRTSISEGERTNKQDQERRDGTNSSGVKADTDSNGENSDYRPGENNREYIQQKGNNEQSHCDLALRKVSMVTILGSEQNGTLYLQHYQLDTEPPFGTGPDKSTDPDLISQIRKEYGTLPKDFSLVLTDYDLKPKTIFQAPISSHVMMDSIDSFSSREPERKREKSKPVTCSMPGAQDEGDSSLLRFMSKRRLLIISTPVEDDYSFQQQLQALNGQACPMGIRHFALLKLVGAGSTASGSVELFPLNGKSQTEHEPLSADMVNGLRDQLKINREYFSMLVVGKDGDVKAWFPSPMWSLVNVYDLVDSMELRQQEQRLQITLGIHCPEDASGSPHGYEDMGEEGYLYRRAED